MEPKRQPDETTKLKDNEILFIKTLVEKTQEGKINWFHAGPGRYTVGDDIKWGPEWILVFDINSNVVNFHAAGAKTIIGELKDFKELLETINPSYHKETFWYDRVEQLKKL